MQIIILKYKTQAKTSKNAKGSPTKPNQYKLFVKNLDNKANYESELSSQSIGELAAQKILKKPNCKNRTQVKTIEKISKKKKQMISELLEQENTNPNPEPASEWVQYEAKTDNLKNVLHRLQTLCFYNLKYHAGRILDTTTEPNPNEQSLNADNCKNLVANPHLQNEMASLLNKNINQNRYESKFLSKKDAVML